MPQKAGLEEESCEIVATNFNCIISPTWHSKNTHPSSLGILGTELDYFPAQQLLL